MEEVSLSLEELDLAIEVGLRRNKEAECSKRKHTVRASSLDGKRNHILGAYGELAVCKLLGVKWSMSVNTFKAEADVLDVIEVRTTSRHHYDLMIRPNDDDRKMFVSVSHEKPSNVFRVRGWLYGTEGKQPEFLKDIGNYGRPAYFVPVIKLHSVSSLREKIRVLDAGRFGIR